MKFWPPYFSDYRWEDLTWGWPPYKTQTALCLGPLSIWTWGADTWTGLCQRRWWPPSGGTRKWRRFSASISRADPHDSIEDAEIGSENGQEAAQLIKTGKSKNDSFIDTSVRTSEFQEGWNVTEKVVDDTEVAERQLEGEAMWMAAFMKPARYVASTSVTLNWEEWPCKGEVCKWPRNSHRPSRSTGIPQCQQKNQNRRTEWHIHWMKWLGSLPRNLRAF